jgi:hypothetical protein
MTVFLDTVGLLAVWDYPKHLPTTDIFGRLDLRRCFKYHVISSHPNRRAQTALRKPGNPLKPLATKISLEF